MFEENILLVSQGEVCATNPSLPHLFLQEVG